MVNRVPVNLPLRSLRRLPSQPGANALADANNFVTPGFPHSTQQDISITHCPSNAGLSAWMAGPPSHPYWYITVQDTHRVLPYTTLKFTVIADDVGPSPSTPYQCNMGLETGMTSGEARDSLVQQINAFAQQFGRADPNLASLHAVPMASEPDAMVIRLPWGMTGFANFTEQSPLAVVPSTRTAGVDRPLSYGILGKRRHIFQVRNGIFGPYYGPVPPT